MAAVRQPSAVDDHPMRRKITDMLLTGKSLRDVRKVIEPKLSIDTLAKFKRRSILPALDRLVAEMQVQNPEAKILPPADMSPHSPQTALVAADPAALNRASCEVSAEISQNPVIARLSSRFKKVDDLLDKAHSELDYGGFANLLNADTRQLQLLARLRGDLSSDERGSQSVQVNVIIPNSARHASDNKEVFGSRGENLEPGARVVSAYVEKK